MVDDLTDRQPHIVTVDAEGNALVIPVFTVRQIANGSIIPNDELTKAVAAALLGMIEDE